MIVAFDFDGTICDSMGGLEDLAVDVIGRYWDVADENVIRQRYRETSGDPFDVQLPRIMCSTGREVSLAVAAYAAEKFDVTIRSKPKKETIAAIHQLIAAHIGVHIISSTTTPIIRTWLREHLVQLESLIHCHGIDMGTKIENLKRCQPDWFVGDSFSDAKRAAMLGIKFEYVDIHEHIDTLLREVLRER
jgi:phosphoglycolate phosphatase-like HAD superfamily hydrolase